MQHELLLDYHMIDSQAIAHLTQFHQEMSAATQARMQCALYSTSAH